MRYVLFFSLLLAGCPLLDGSKDTADTGSAGGSGGAGAPTSLSELSDPCGGATPYGLLFEDSSHGWVGCGDGMGLWETTDGGATFDRAIQSGNLYVFDLRLDADGRLLVCGHDYDDAQKTLLYRSSGDGWESLLRYGSHDEDAGAVYMSNCGLVGELGGGRLVVASNTTGDISWSEDGGATWSAAETYWEDDNLDDPEAHSIHEPMSLVVVGDQWYAGGSYISDPPEFMGPSSNPAASWYNLDAQVISDEVQGEVWALATPDGGTTWLAGGRDQGAGSFASAFLFRSTDGGSSWTRVELGDAIDIVHDIAFTEDGSVGLAVGERYPVSKGGFLLYSTDGGASWTEYGGELPALQSVAIAGDHFWIAGAGYLAGGSL